MNVHQCQLRALSACITIMLLHIPNSSMAEVYRWEDTKGTTHFTDRRPTQKDSVDKVKIRDKRIGEQPAPAVATTTTSDKKTTDNGYAERCKQAKKNKQILDTIQEIHRKGPDGENIVLDAAEKKSRLEESKKLIEIYCN